MSQFNYAYKINIELEYSSNPKKFLHKNSTEESVTLGGVYRSANPDAIDWKFVDNIIDTCETNVINIDDTNRRQQEKEDLERASCLLFYDEKMQFEVFSLFKKAYWDKNLLSEVQSQKSGNRIFLMAVNTGNKQAIKIAQRVSFALVDGIVGPVTIRCINNMSERDFKEQYDRACIEYYENLAKEKPHLAVYLQGWINRIDRIEELEDKTMLFV